MAVPEDGRHWQEQVIRSDNRPRRLYQYWVSGSGVFPACMLAEDQCWPFTQNDVDKIVISQRFSEIKRRSIQMASHLPPSTERWRNWGWRLSTEPE